MVGNIWVPAEFFAVVLSCCTSLLFREIVVGETVRVEVVLLLLLDPPPHAAKIMIKLNAIRNLRTWDGENRMNPPPPSQREDGKWGKM